MSDQVLDQQPVVDNAQPSTPSAENDSGEQSEVSLSRYRAQRQGGRPPIEDRKPYAHGDQPFQKDKWRPDSENQDRPGAESKSGVQKRIDRLVRERSELERRLAESGKSQPPTEPAQNRQFESVEDYSARVIREATERERNAAQQKPSSEQPAEHQRGDVVQLNEQQQQEYARAHAFKAQTFAQRCDAAFKADPELAEIRKNSASNAVMVPAVLHPALVETPNGHDVAIWLAKHPEQQRRIAMIWQTSGEAVFHATGNATAAGNAAAIAVIREVQRISNALEFGTALPAARQPIQRPVSTAPAPITPVSGGAGPTARDDGNSDGEEVNLRQYMKSRERQRNPRRG